MEIKQRLFNVNGMNDNYTFYGSNLIYPLKFDASDMHAAKVNNKTYMYNVSEWET